MDQRLGQDETSLIFVLSAPGGSLSRTDQDLTRKPGDFFSVILVAKSMGSCRFWEIFSGKASE